MISIDTNKEITDISINISFVIFCFKINLEVIKLPIKDPNRVKKVCNNIVLLFNISFFSLIF